MADRRSRVWQQYLDGRTQRDIAATEGVSVFTINKDLQTTVAEFNQQHADRQQILRARQSALVDRIVRSNLRHTDAPDLNTRRAAHETILSALNREAKLWDLDLRQATGESAERILAMLHGLTGLFMELVTDPVIQRRWVEGIRNRVKPALAQQLTAGEVLEAEAQVPQDAGEDAGKM